MKSKFHTHTPQIAYAVMPAYYVVNRAVYHTRQKTPQKTPTRCRKRGRIEFLNANPSLGGAFNDMTLVQRHALL